MQGGEPWEFVCHYDDIEGSSADPRVCAVSSDRVQQAEGEQTESVTRYRLYP